MKGKTENKINFQDREQKIPLNSEKNDDLDNLTFYEKLIFVKDNITVEPCLGFFVIMSVVTMLTTQNLNLEKACRVNLKYNDTICTALTLRKRDNLSYEEDEVQKLVASVEGWKTVVHTMFPILLMLFTGAWSDKTGRRKVCILMPILGEFITSIICLTNTYFFYEVPVEWTAFFAIIFPALTGAWSIMFLGVFSYIVDITSSKTRTFRLGVLSLGLTLGVPIGTGLSGILLRYVGYYGVFGISALVQLLNFLYIFFYIEDHRWRENNTKTKRVVCGGFLVEFFNFKGLKDTISIVFKKGPNNRRLKVCLIMTVNFLSFGPFWGETTILYIFCRYKFNWDEVKYSVFSTYSFISHTVGTLILITIFSKKLKWDDTVLGVMATVSKVTGAIVWAFARNTTEIYIAPIVELFCATIVIALRSISSKSVPSQELGKVYSLFGLVEAMVPLITGPLYTRVYILTLHILPGAVFLITVFATIPSIGIFIWFYRIHKKDRNDERRISLDIKLETENCEM